MGEMGRIAAPGTGRGKAVGGAGLGKLTGGAARTVLLAGTARLAPRVVIKTGRCMVAWTFCRGARIGCTGAGALGAK